jgi:deoxyribodipyrimidine photo-lyase
MDFSKYALKRDTKIYNVCKQHNVKLIIFKDDLFLNNSELYLNHGKPYLVFGVFFKKAIKIKPRKIFGRVHNFTKRNISFEYKKNIHNFYDNENILIDGGRSNAIRMLKNNNKFKNYEKFKDKLDYQTTLLSSYLKFGCVSLNEVFHVFKKNKLYFFNKTIILENVLLYFI